MTETRVKSSESAPPVPASKMIPDAEVRSYAPIVQTDGLSKWFGEVVAVNNLTADIEPGVTGLLGPNGAGKSTFIRLILGLYAPSRGTISVLGGAPRNNLPVLRRIGYCPESDTFYEGMTGFEFVMWLNRYAGLGARAARLSAENACDRVGMSERKGDPITTYSKGMRQRIKIAQALARDPELMVLDEPMQGLDPEGREEIFSLVRELGQEGRSVIMSSHILYEIERVTNQVLLLHNGSVLAHGTVRHIRDLIDEHPHAITIEGPDVRIVGDRFVRNESTISMEFDGTTAVIRTRDPNGSYQALNDMVLDEGIALNSIRCSDDDLQSVFKYLVR